MIILNDVKSITANAILMGFVWKKNSLLCHKSMDKLSSVKFIGPDEVALEIFREVGADTRQE